jgi:hypothetical protein
MTKETIRTVATVISAVVNITMVLIVMGRK